MEYDILSTVARKILSRALSHTMDDILLTRFSHVRSCTTQDECEHARLCLEPILYGFPPPSSTTISTLASWWAGTRARAQTQAWQQPAGNAHRSRAELRRTDHAPVSASLGRSPLSIKSGPRSLALPGLPNFEVSARSLARRCKVEKMSSTPPSSTSRGRLQPLLRPPNAAGVPHAPCRPPCLRSLPCWLTVLAG